MFKRTLKALDNKIDNMFFEYIKQTIDEKVCEYRFSWEMKILEECGEIPGNTYRKMFDGDFVMKIQREINQDFLSSYMQIVDKRFNREAKRSMLENILKNPAPLFDTYNMDFNEYKCWDTVGNFFAIICYVETEKWIDAVMVENVTKYFNNAYSEIF